MSAVYTILKYDRGRASVLFITDQSELPAAEEFNDFEGTKELLFSKVKNFLPEETLNE